MKSKKGFTFAEIMVVVLIIGILTSITIPGYRTSTMKAKIASNMPFLRSLQNDMLNYYDRTGSLPTSINQLAINNAEFNNNVHIPTGCTITIQNTPGVKMDCNEGWNMLYSLQSSAYGYSLGPNTFNITVTGSEKTRLQKIANSFGWQMHGNGSYTIK